jgi:two-component system, cell cycle sensor histidine kinase and response regulator CckA
MATAASFPWPFGGGGTELQLVFENAPLGIAQCDREGTILAVNPTLRTMLGGKLQAIQHPRFSDLVSVQDRDLHLGMFRQLMNGERASFQLESLLSRTDGAARWLRWTAWGVCGSAHNPDCVLLLAEDVTEAHIQEQKAVHAEGLQALGRMAGSIAHDFNNLLTGILLYCDLILSNLSADGLSAAGPRTDRVKAAGPTGNGSPESDRLRKYAEEIRSASIQATGVVQQLLTVTRPRSLSPHPVSLNAIAEEMRDLLLRLVGENIELSFQLDPGLELVKMDPAQARQILLNLVLNARDAMPEGGRIQVETSNCSAQVFRDESVTRAGASGETTGQGRLAAIPCVLFVVSDTGCGMNEETRQRVFQAYFSTKEEGRGSGLGLATVHDIVAGRGGLVQVESAPDQGTRVFVLLPSVSAPTSRGSARSSPHAA